MDRKAVDKNGGKHPEKVVPASPHELKSMKKQIEDNTMTTKQLEDQFVAIPVKAKTETTNIIANKLNNDVRQKRREKSSRLRQERSERTGAIRMTNRNQEEKEEEDDDDDDEEAKPDTTRMTGGFRGTQLGASSDDNDDFSHDFDFDHDDYDTSAYTEVNESDNQNRFLSVEVVDDNELAARYADKIPTREEVERKILSDVPQATEIDHHAEKKENDAKKSFWTYTIVFAGIMVVILIITLMVIFSLKRNETPNTKTTTQVPTSSPTVSDFTYVQELLLDISGDTLFDSSSDQYHALEWLVYDDPANLEIQNITDQSIVINRYVLALLYFATGGPTHWTYQHTFLSNYSICDWGQILCNTHGDVVAINLDGSNLTGTIPSELSAIKTIEKITVLGNNLYGTIPSSLGELSYLAFLQLASNYITGTIPNSFEKLVNLEFFNLGYNELTGTIPENITRNAIHLEELWLAFNHLTGPVPFNFGQNRRMVWIDLYTNNLNGSIPRTLFEDQPDLEYLDLSYNRITGTIPISRTKDIGDSLQKLRFLYLENNLLTGTIPTYLGRLDYLSVLALYKNKLNGTLPTEIGNCFDLKYLFISDNELTGTIPTELGLLRKLIELIGDSNNFTGMIPSSLLTLSKNLEIVDLSNNSIVGDLDSTFCEVHEQVPINYISLDCGGSNPEIKCPCCHVCCNDDSGNCKTDLHHICEAMASSLLLESGDYTNINATQSICNCTDDGRSFSCVQKEGSDEDDGGDDVCQTCNIDGTVCGYNTDFGYAFDEDGTKVNWTSSFRYVLGRNETISYFRSKTDCMVHINGQECSSCLITLCRDEFLTFQTDCRNIIDLENDNDDGYGYYQGCRTKDHYGVFEVFNMFFTDSWIGGCEPLVMVYDI